MPYEFQNTTYGGITVTKNTKEMLENQPAAAFLRFEKRSGNMYSITSKLPEMGCTKKGKEFKIRENINRFMMGVSRCCLGEDGKLDPVKADAFLTDESQWMDTGDEPPEDFLQKCGINDTNREDFMTFYKQGAIHDWLVNNVRFTTGGYMSTVERIRNYAHEMNERPLKNDGTVDPDTPEAGFIAGSYDDYRNAVNSVSEMANMNPAEETRMLFFADCNDSANMNEAMLPYVNRYRKAHGLEEVEGEKHRIDFKDPEDDPEHDRYKAFAAHFTFEIKVQNGKDTGVISLETTAPPTGKYMYVPSEGRTAVGLYPDSEAVIRFHHDHNMVTVPHEETLVNMMKEGAAHANSITELPVDETLEASYNARKERLRAAAVVAPERHSFRNIQLTAASRANWRSALKEIYDGFRDTDSIFSNDSPAYTELRDSLKQLLNEDLANMTSGVQLNNALEEIAGKNQAYLDHCIADPKADSSRRDARIRVSQMLTVLHEAADKGITDPNAYVKAKLADSFYERVRTDKIEEKGDDMDARVAVDKQFDKPSYRETFTNTMMNSAAFRRMTDGKNINQLYDLIEKRDRSFDRYMQLYKTLDEPAIHQRQQAAANQVSRQANAPSQPSVKQNGK